MDGLVDITLSIIRVAARSLRGTKDTARRAIKDVTSKPEQANYRKGRISLPLSPCPLPFLTAGP